MKKIRQSQNNELIIYVVTPHLLTVWLEDCVKRNKLVENRYHDSLCVNTYRSCL